MTQQTVLFGVIGTEPEQLTTRTGIPMTSFRLAHHHRYFSAESSSWVDGPTSWFTVTAYRSLAQNICRALSKGERVFVAGRIQIREFTREDGTTGKDVGLIAESVGPDLRFGSRAAGAGAASSENFAQPAGQESGAEPDSGHGQMDHTAAGEDAPETRPELVGAGAAMEPPF